MEELIAQIMLNRTKLKELDSVIGRLMEEQANLEQEVHDQIEALLKTGDPDDEEVVRVHLR